jgi:hypothetical protein
MNKYEQHRATAAAQRKQELLNAAKTLAYANGLYMGGWLVECDGHIDGFRSDYCFVHSNPANIACHKVKTVWVVGDEATEYKADLDEVLADCEKENDHRPEVKVITDDVETACKTLLKQSVGEETVEEFVEELWSQDCDEEQSVNTDELTALLA